ncbi:MAG: GNAT family N-acetyltransferase [Planctomycetota bacterium]
MGEVTEYTTYRPSNEEQEQAFLKFWNENHDGSLDEKYRAWYQDNPAGKATVVLVKDSGNEHPIGCVAVFPRKVSFRGVDLRAGAIGDLLVHKKHRIGGPALTLQRELVSIVEEGQFDFIYGYPNKRAEPVLRRAGFRCLGPRTRLAKLVRISERLRKSDFYRYVDPLLSPWVDAMVKLLTFETWYRRKGGFTCEQIGGFDGRFDGLWMKSRSRFPAVGERTSKFLRWRYPARTDGEHRVFTISSCSGAELEGYIVYCPDGRSIRIEDLVLPDDRKAIRVFMTQFLRHVRKESIQSVSVHMLANGGVPDILKGFGFVQQRSDRNIYYYCSERLLRRFPSLADPASWLLSDFDVDNFRI